MFSDETSKNFQAAKALEQYLVAQALLDVVERHKAWNEPIGRAVAALPKHPSSAEVADVIAVIRKQARSCPTPLVYDACLAVFVGSSLEEPLHAVVQALPQPQTTVDLFETTRRAAERTVSSSRPALLSHRARLLWNAFMGSRVGTFLFGHLCPFDPKGFGWNASGRLFSEQFQDGHDHRLTLDWTAGPTPTVGDHVAPETWAAIEAMEHNRSLCFPHTMWIYVNIQNLRGASEKRRSKALIEASQHAPAIFRVASLTVDAPFYLGKVSSLQTVNDHARNLRSELRKGLSPHPDRWYAFCLQDGEREEWWSEVEQVLDTALALAQSTGDPIFVFHELVVIGLVRAWQGFCCKMASGHVMSTVACKECIDRGGSVNAAYTWALSEDNELRRAQDVMAVLWGRPLLAKRRLINRMRTRGFESLVRNVLPSLVRTYLQNVWAHACRHRWTKEKTQNSG
jgi:hypothetical protein